MGERAYLLVDHGSRVAAANEPIGRVAAALRERLPGAIVKLAHLEFTSPSIAEGIRACVEAGASEIIVHPYFLSPGRHTREHIPELVAEALREHPGVTARITDPLGFHPRLLDVVLDRIAALE